MESTNLLETQTMVQTQIAPKVSLVDYFQSTFSIVIANTVDLKTEAYKIRHKVYSEEYGWEPLKNNKLETDTYDKYSTSLLLECKTYNKIIGTIRLVYPPGWDRNAQLPFETHFMDKFRSDIIDPNEMRRGTFGEISRLCTLQEFRGRMNDYMNPTAVRGLNHYLPEEYELPKFPHTSIGLYLALLAYMSIIRLSKAFVVINPLLKRSLDQNGLHFLQCSDEINFHGRRALFYMPRAAFETGLTEENKELYNFLRRELRKQMLATPDITTLYN